MTPSSTNKHLGDLASRLERMGSVLVAFSGGADSAFLLVAAIRTLGTSRVAAATAVSPSLAPEELAQAREFAQGLGVTHLTPRTSEMKRAGYVANGADRCFHCKSELLTVLIPLAHELGLATVATGTNADDVLDRFRPGIRAAARLGALTPLSDVGLTKQQIRDISRAWGLVTADKPAAACLSSRIAYGIPIDETRLARVGRAEATLRIALAEAGLRVENVRVRDLGREARVEVDRQMVEELSRRPELLAAVAGFEQVTLDPLGFRSGSMNEALQSGSSRAANSRA